MTGFTKSLVHSGRKIMALRRPKFGQLPSTFIGAFALQHQNRFVRVGTEIEFPQDTRLIRLPGFSSFRFQNVVCELAVVDAGNLFFESQYLHASRP